MSFSELLDAVKALPREEKVHLMQSIKDEVGEVTEDELLLAKHFPPGAVFEIFSPFDCFEAAAILEQMLAEEKAKR